MMKKIENNAGYTAENLVKDVWEDGEVLVADQATADAISSSGILEREGIMAFASDGGVLFSRSNSHGRVEKKSQHKYVMPPFADEVRTLLRMTLEGRRSFNILLQGAAGTGKTQFVHEISREMGFAKVYQVNGSDGLTAADFYGTMGVEVDAVTGQNFTKFVKGPLYRAFIEGTKLDADGNQVLDGNGEPIVTGAPAVFFLDEFAAMLPEVFLGVFNRVLEIPRDNGRSRSMEVPGDGGRIVKSHPGMVVMLAGNTVGTGNSGRYQMGYTAQSGKMDESTLNRFSVGFRFGYNRAAESEIAHTLLQDDYEADRVVYLCRNLRDLYRNEKVERLFTTRTLVELCGTAAAYRDAGIDDYMVKAIRDTVMSTLSEQDIPAFNESIRIIYGIDLQAQASADKDYDYI